MADYALGLSYDGSQFHGWQRQQLDTPTVQAVLETALSRIADHHVATRVAGRTDAGVHATGQVAAFSTDAARTLHDWQRGLNALSPTTVHINWVCEVPAVFHPRYSAVARRYVYLYHDTGSTTPFLNHHVWQCKPLDADAMHRAAQILIGEHDFSSFRGAGCQSLTPMRRVNRVSVTRRGHWVIMEIEANAFLLHMVRNVARALHDVGLGKALHLDKLLAAQNRTLLGATAPPDGLYLSRVSYPDFDLPEPAAVPFLSGPSADDPTGPLKVPAQGLD